MSRWLRSLCVLAALCSSAITEAAYTPATEFDAADRLLSFGIITPYSLNDPLGLRENITRAQDAVVLVTADRKVSEAELLKGTASFTDTADHWASGYIAQLKKIAQERSGNGDAIGMPDGTFAPEAHLTVSEAVAFLLAFTGTQPDSGKTWPDNYFSPAVANGILSSEDATTFSSKAGFTSDRGMTFYLTDRFLSTRLPQFQSKSYYEFHGYPVPEVGAIWGVCAAAMVIAIRRRKTA